MTEERRRGVGRLGAVLRGIAVDTSALRDSRDFRLLTLGGFISGLGTQVTLQDLDHVGMVKGITRYARTVREASLVPRELDEAFARAAGDGGEPGPAYLDFPTDVLRADVPPALQDAEHLAGRPRVPGLHAPSCRAAASQSSSRAGPAAPMCARGRRDLGA